MPTNYLPYSYGPKGLKPTYPVSKKAPAKNNLSAKINQTLAKIKPLTNPFRTKTTLPPGAQLYVPGGSFGALPGGAFPGPVPYVMNTTPPKPKASINIPQPVWNNIPVPQLAPPKAMPVPTAAQQSPAAAATVAAASGPDPFAAFLAEISKPQDVKHLNIAMPNLPDLDLKYIYDKYAPMTTNAYDQLMTKLGEIKTGAESTFAGNRQNMADQYTALNADMTAGNVANKSSLDETIKRLGLDEATARPEYQRIADTQNRLDSLIKLTQGTRQNTQGSLDQARLGSFDTLNQLAAGGKARGLQDLIDTVTGGEIQGAQNKQSALGEIAKLISGGEVDYQKLQMQLGDSALDRKMKIFGFMADQQAAQAKAAADAAANNPYQETTTDTYENQPFWESMQAATAGDPVAAALLKTTNDRAGSSPTKMQELLSELSSPQVKSPFGSSFLNTISNLGKPLVSPQSMAESQAAQKLLQAYQNYGGFGGAPTTTRKVTYKT